MKMNFTHGTTPGNARKKIETLLNRLESEHKGELEVTERTWSGDTLHFAFKAKGLPAKGTIEVDRDEVYIEGKVPLIAKPFEKKIKTAIEKQASALFPTRKA